MSLEKLEQIINEMEKIGDDFKRYKEVYQELTDLQEKIANSIEELKGNKDSLESLNKDITSSVDNLKNKVEELNSLLPQKMLEIMTSNKDIQIDIKTKHEELIKILNKEIDNLSTNVTSLNDTFNNKMEELSKSFYEKFELFTQSQEKQSKHLLVLSILVSITLLVSIIPYVMHFIK